MIEKRTPDSSHLVLYDAVGLTPVGKVLKVYLLDPRTTRGPVDTPFRLGTSGVHCGFEHGTFVWLKFMLRAPTFTGVPFDNSKIYVTGDLVYDPVTGECFVAGSNIAPITGPAPVYGPVTLLDAATATNTALTSATAIFSKQDVGASVAGPGIPADTVIASVTNSSTVVLSHPTTATGSALTMMIGPRLEQVLDPVESFTDGVTTNANPNLACASADFGPNDIGAPIDCVKFPAGTYIKSVTNATTVVLSNNALSNGTDVAVTVGPPGGRWQKVPFPFQLAEPVIRGAYADVQRSEDQTDKAQIEEQGSERRDGRAGCRADRQRL